MKTLALGLTVAAACWLLLSPARADTVVLEGTVVPVCSLSGEGFTDFPDSTITRTIDLSNPHSMASVHLNLHVSCTQNFKIAIIPHRARFENVDAPPGTLQNPMVGDAYIPGGTPVPGFAGGLKYTFNAVLGGVTLPFGGVGPSYTSPGFGPGVGVETFTLTPRSEPLVVTFNPTELPPSMSLIAGTYEETITIQLTPTGL